MKRFVLTFAVCALGVCAPVAQAVTIHKVAPAGNSGVNEYIESIPTDHGNRPTNSVHSSGSHTGGGGGGGISNGGGGGGSGGSGGPISGPTQRALSAYGADGTAAAALAQNTAPQVPRARRTSDTPAAASDDPARAAATSGGSSVLGSLAAAFTGSDSVGGLGALLPVILIVVLFGTATLAILRRRSNT